MFALTHFLRLMYTLGSHKSGISSDLKKSDPYYGRSGNLYFKRYQYLLSSPFCCCCLPCNHCSNWTWVVEEMFAYGYRLRSTHCREFHYLKLCRLAYFVRTTRLLPNPGHESLHIMSSNVMTPPTTLLFVICCFKLCCYPAMVTDPDPFYYTNIRILEKVLYV